MWPRRLEVCEMFGLRVLCLTECWRREGGQARGGELAVELLGGVESHGAAPVIAEVRVAAGDGSSNSLVVEINKLRPEADLLVSALLLGADQVLQQDRPVAQPPGNAGVVSV